MLEKPHLRTVVHLIPSWITMGLLAVSFWYPFWESNMKAPQYPDGLKLIAYQDHVEGDVDEINTLNHYVGMSTIDKVAALERKLAPMALMFCMVHLLYVPFVKNYLLRALFILPSALYPIVAIIDMNHWIKFLGQHLDPEAPLSMTVKPFVAPLVGDYKVANFDVSSHFGTGANLLFIAAGFAFVGFLTHLILWALSFRKKAEVKCSQ